MPDGLLSILGIAGLKSYVVSLGRYAGIQMGLVAALLVTLALAAGFGVAAITIWLASLWGAAVAFAVVGAGFFVAALLLEVVILLRRNRRPGIVPPFKADMPGDQVLGTIAAMAIVGYLLGRRFMRR